MVSVYLLAAGLTSVLIGVVPLLFVRRSRRALLVAGAAFFSAVIAKAIVQLSFLPFFLTPQVQTYLAYGALTAVTEPGFAYLFARLLRDCPEAYGVSLAFWENAVVVGASMLAASFFVPTPFDAVNLMLVAVERTSSLLIHYAWGVTAFYSYARKDPRYVLATAPFGMVDSLAAYADLTRSSVLVVEVVAFIAGVVAFAIARAISRHKPA